MNTFALVIQREKIIKGSKASVKWREEIQVDGKRCGQNHCIDYYELVRSLSADGEFFIFTCGCGSAGCSGINEGIQIHHADGKVVWQVTEPKPKQCFRFTEQQYSQSIYDGLNAAAKALPRKGTFPLGHTFFTLKQFKQCLDTARLCASSLAGLPKPVPNQSAE